MTEPGAPREGDARLQGRTVVVIGGSSGIGRETARLARGEGADVVLVGRDPGRLRDAASDVGATRTEAFDATDPAAAPCRTHVESFDLANTMGETPQADAAEKNSIFLGKKECAIGARVFARQVLQLVREILE